jgi:hypothetical protein
VFRTKTSRFLSFVLLNHVYITEQAVGLRAAKKGAEEMRLKLSVPVVMFLTACTPGIQPAVRSTPSITNLSSTSLPRGALSGTLQYVDFYYSIDPTCASIGLATVRILSQPKNGRVQIEESEGYTSFRLDNARFACNSKKVPGTLIRYQSTPGFTGTDTVTVEVIFAGGSYAKNTYVINVR